MGNPRVVYHPHADISPEDELRALVSVYSFVLSCAEEREKGGSTTNRPNDGTKVKGDSADAPIIRR
jgi:hypothetical protein